MHHRDRLPLHSYNADVIAGEEVFPVGIVYGGFPGANRASELSEEASADAFLTERDILIRALKLTPDVFDDWVRRCGF